MAFHGSPLNSVILEFHGITLGACQNHPANWYLYAPGYAPYIYIGFGNLFLAYAPGYAPRPKASKFQPMLHGPEPSATFAVAPMLLQEKRYAPRYALNLKLPSAAWGSLPLKLGMRWVCAGHIPRWSSGSNWNTSGIPLESIWNNGMRQRYAPLVTQRERGMRPFMRSGMF